MNIDLDKAVTEIGDGLGFGVESAEPAELTEAAAADPGAAPTSTPAEGELGQKPQTELNPNIKPTPAPEGTAPAPEGAAPGPAGWEAPKTWRKEAAAEFPKLPPVVQAEIAKREEDMFKGLDSYRKDAGIGKGFKDTIAPFLPACQQQGIDPLMLTKSLLNAHYTLTFADPNRKVEMLAKIAQEYGLGDRFLVAPEEDAALVDPQVARLRQELDTIKAQMAQTTSAKEREIRENVQRDIEAFSKDPANIYFDEVAGDIAKLIAGGVAKDLKEAYELAIWHNPTVRAKEQARVTAEQAAKGEAEAKARAEAVKKATAANIKSKANSGGASTAPLGTMDETLAETLAALRNRGN